MCVYIYIYTHAYICMISLRPLLEAAVAALGHRLKRGTCCCYCTNTHRHPQIHTYTHIQSGMQHAYIDMHPYINIHIRRTCMHACMHACMHTYMQICLHAYRHTCIHAHMHSCMHACIHACIHTDIRVHTHNVYMHACIHEYLRRCSCAHIHMQSKRACMQTHLHVRIHTCISK